jgi:SAM-dependent methyltransferase
MLRRKSRGCNTHGPGRCRRELNASQRRFLHDPDSGVFLWKRIAYALRGIGALPAPASSEHDMSPEDPEWQDLLAQARTLCDDPYFREVVWLHCGHLAPGVTAAQLDTAIHVGDQMLLHSLRHHRDANASFAQYFNVALQQYNAAQQVLRALFPGATDRIDVLDFACGYGRLLRFLSLAMPRQHLYASEIQADALQYVRESFGVQGIASHGSPDDFRPGRSFDLIWVASLFSHLPERLFEAWLRRLVDCLAPDGVLCFSVHDACLVPEGHVFPDSGFLFWPQSENDDLDTSLYGTTYVCEDYVTGVIARVCGADRPWFRIPRGLAHEQDLYLVAARPGRDLSVLRNFRRGPWGWADERELSPSGEVHVRGWAASLDDGPLDAVEISVDGVLHRCPTGLAREDVARVLADPRLASAGWEFRHVPPPGEGPLRVVVSARTPQNERALIYTGRFERPPALRATTPAAPRRGLLKRLAGWLRQG